MFQGRESSPRQGTTESSPTTSRLGRFLNGTTFTDGKATAKNPEELQRMFASHGANEVYARIATTQKYRTGFGDHSIKFRPSQYT